MARILGNLVDSHQGLRRVAAERLEIELPGGTVVVEPDVWISRSDGTLLLREFRTGRRGSFPFPTGRMPRGRLPGGRAGRTPSLISNKLR